MSFNTYRIRGRISKAEDANNIFPKFLVLNEEPFLEQIIESVEELAEVDDEERIFEPVELGLGVKSKLMYVKENQRTYLFSYPIVGDISWGSSIVTFVDNIDFEGNVSPL